MVTKELLLESIQHYEELQKSNQEQLRNYQKNNLKF